MSDPTIANLDEPVYIPPVKTDDEVTPEQEKVTQAQAAEQAAKTAGQNRAKSVEIKDKLDVQTPGVNRKPAETLLADNSTNNTKATETRQAEVEGKLAAGGELATAKPKHIFTGFDLESALQQTSNFLADSGALAVKEKAEQLNAIQKVLGGDSQSVKDLVALHLRNPESLSQEGLDAKSLEMITSDLTEKRASKESQTDVQKQEVLDSHKALLTGLIDSKLPEERKHEAGMAASLLVHAKDNPETEVNELAEFTNALAAASKEGEADLADVVSKADAALGHLEREELAEVYSDVIHKQMQSMGLGETLDPDRADPQAADALLKGYSKPIADIFSRLDSSQRADLINMAGKFTKADSLDQVTSALTGDEESLNALGVNAEKMADTKLALANASLNYLKDEIGLSQGDVNKISQLYQLSDSLAGADGKFNQDDIPALAAALGVNDLKSLEEAKALVQDTIMSAVSKSALAEANKQFFANPEAKSGIAQIKNGENRLANGIAKANAHPFLARLTGGWGKIAAGQGQLSAGKGQLEHQYQTQAIGAAKGAIKDIKTNLGDDFDPVTRALAGIETRDELSANFGITKETSAVDHKAAMETFAKFSKAPLNEANKESLRKAFMNINSTGVRDDIKNGITEETRDLTGTTKDALLGINKYLMMEANLDVREGITQENLKTLEESKDIAQGVLDKVLEKQGFEGKVDIQDASALISRYRNGEIELSEVSSELGKLATQPDPETVTRKLVEDHFDEAKKFDHDFNFAAFKDGDKTVLGYQAEGGHGFYKENSNGERKPAKMSSEQIISYEASLKEGAHYNPDADPSRGLSEPEENLATTLAKEHGLIRKQAGATDQAHADYLKENSMAAFKIGDKEYLGYKVEDPKTRELRAAHVDTNGKTYFTNDESMKAAYNKALVGNGLEDIKIDPSLFENDDRSFSSKVSEEVLGADRDYKEFSATVKNGTVDQYLKENKMSGFTVNGKNYLGYQTNEPETKLAYMDAEGKTAYVNDEATKAALYGAMQRDGLDISSIRQFGEVDSEMQNTINAIASSNNKDYSNLPRESVFSRSEYGAASSYNSGSSGSKRAKGDSGGTSRAAKQRWRR